MGFERLVSVLQDKRSNYDTDVFAPIFDEIQRLTGARSYEGKLGKDDTDGIDTAYRVVADHVRTLTFALSDGGMPSNVGRGYVLRRILRRGARYVRKKFNVPIGHFFSDLMTAVVTQLVRCGHFTRTSVDAELSAQSDFFPELAAKTDELKEILDEEEESFARTLDRGEKLFEMYAQDALASTNKTLAGKDVWRLYDTYGFPVDLTLLMAEELGLGVDQQGFEKAQHESKEASKGGSKAANGQNVRLDVHDIGALEQNDMVAKTDDSFKYSAYDGSFKYAVLTEPAARGSLGAKVVAIYQSSKFHDTTDTLAPGQPLGVILDRTNFYAESGGQEYDTGHIVIDGVADFAVEDVQVFNGYVLHIGQLREGGLAIGNEVIAVFDEVSICSPRWHEHAHRLEPCQTRRWPLRKNHTATHILNYALREVLGEHVDQKGSLVAQNKLRFDFSNKGAISVKDLAKIEDISNDWVKRNVAVFAQDLDLATAQKIPGLRAVFGEAYPDPVRVVVLGHALEEILKDIDNPKWRDTSVEFCGGT